MKRVGLGLAVVLGIVSCTGSVRYRCDQQEVSHGALLPLSYRVILHGGTNGDDLETAAFLDREDDAWELVPASPEFKYRVFKGVNSVPAIRKAEEFVGFHPEFDRVQVRSVCDKNGEIFAYEVRPLYRQHKFGRSDILDISYVPEEAEHRMKIYVRVDPSVEREDDSDKTGPEPR